MPPKVSSGPGTALINGIPYRCNGVDAGVDEDWVDGQASEPDIHWSHVDSNGHSHAFDSYSGELPTLIKTNYHVVCGNDCSVHGCEGYDETRFFCHICNERVQPQWNTITRSVKVSELHWWKTTVSGPLIMPGTKVSVRIQSGEWPEKFGIATVTGADFSEGDDAQLTLEGIGRLGFRPLDRV